MTQSRRTRVEDYLSAVEQICEERGIDRASTGSVAAILGVSNGTASSTLKQLAESGLVDNVPYEGASLTDVGRRQARRVLRRRRLLELYLSKTLGVAWESVADEARRIEPMASEDLMNLVDQFLEHPKFDPHGDPIPAADGTLPESKAIVLTHCKVNETVVLRRVKAQSDETLQFLREAGLTLGVQMRVLVNSPVSGTVECEINGAATTLGYKIADQLMVESCEAQQSGDAY